MARDVEFNVTANDKTGNGLAAVERKFKESNKRVEDENKKHAKKLEDVLGAGLSDAITKASPKVAAGLGQAFSEASAAAGPLLAVGVAAAAPLISATISAAISVGASLGVVALGVALVAGDAKVKAATAGLKMNITDALHTDASPFITPVLGAIKTVQAGFDDLQPTIRNIFKNGAGFVKPLTDGAVRGLQGIVRGVDELVAKSQPVIDQLGESLGDLGQDFGDFLAGVDTTGATAAIKDLTSAIGTLLDITGPLISGLSKVYGILSKFGVVKYFAEQLAGPIGMLLPLLDTADGKFRAVSKSTDAAGSSFQDAAGDTYDYTQGLKDAEAAVDAVYQSNRDLYSSTTSVAQAFADASKAAKKNGDTLSLNSQKGRDNREALSSVADALNRNYASYVKVNGAGAGASALAGQLRGKFVALAEKMGASASQARNLANKLLGIPNVNRHVNVATAQANAAANALKAKLASIKDRSVYIQVAFNEGRINKVENTLARLGNHQFSAHDALTLAADSSGGQSRVGGPTRVSVDQQLTVSLDGRPFYAYTASKISSSEQRQAWRAKVGQR